MKKWDTQEINKIIELAKNNVSCSEIAKIIGRTKKSVQLKFQRLKISLAKESKVYNNCKNCNNIFESLKGEHKVFCSQSCAASFNNKVRKINYSETKKAYCKKCNKEFFINKRASLKNAVCEDCKKTRKEIYDKENIIRKIKYCKVCKINEVIGFKIICESCKIKYYKFYRAECEFKFPLNMFPEEFDIKLIKEIGWYSPTNKNNNLKGVSRDHVFSVKDGFLIGINPIILRHPANCKLVPHIENQSKGIKSQISLKKLLKKIELFEKKHKTKEAGDVAKELIRLKKTFK